MRETLLEFTSPLGEPCRLFKNVWGKENEAGETVSIVTGLQGGHFTGLYVLNRLTAFLDRVAEGRQSGYRLNGCIQLFPLVHLRAFEAGAPAWSFDQLDTDMAFPGTVEGELTETLCNVLLQHTVRSEYGLLLKGPLRWHRDAPHLCLYQPDRPVRSLARTLGLAQARLLPPGPSLNLQLLKHWGDCGVQALQIATGGQSPLDARIGDQLHEGLVNFLLMTGLLSHPAEKGSRTQVTFYGPKGHQAVSAGQAGLFLAAREPGVAVQPGEKIGEIRDLYGGRLLEEISAGEEGWLVTLREYPLVYSGEPVAWLLTEKYPRWYWPFG